MKLQYYKKTGIPFPDRLNGCLQIIASGLWLNRVMDVESGEEFLMSDETLKYLISK